MISSEQKKKVVVIGGGPGGYPAAFHAADLGFDVTLVDMEAAPGGVCLYRGCIPSKTLLHAAKLIHEMKSGAEMGVAFGEPQVDLDKLRNYTTGVIHKLTGGLGVMSKKRDISFVQGRAKFNSSTQITVDGDDGQTTIDYDHAIIATGSKPTHIPGLWQEHPRIMDSTDALKLPDIPENMLVIGGGYIGLELATVYHALGTNVAVVEATGTLLPSADRDLVDVLEKRLRKMLNGIFLNTKVTEMTPHDDHVEVKLVGLDIDPPVRKYDKVLMAVGRRPNADNLGLDNTNVQLTDKGFIQVDAQRKTHDPHISAIGDVAGEPMLAHKATYEGHLAAQSLADKPTAFDPAAIPAVVFTDPEVAWAGLTELDARTQGMDVKISAFPWGASGRATTLDRNDGLTKMILDPRTDRILGIGIVGVGAGELIAEGVLAIEMGARAADLQQTIHAHPTLSETMMEAAEAHFGHSPHIYQKPQNPAAV